MSLNYEELNERQLVAETDEFTAERYRQFAALLPKTCFKILDVGCSTGRGGAELKRIRPLIQLHGFDCSEKRLAQLPEAYEGRHCGDVRKMPFEDEEFDAVLMGEFIEHLYPHDVDPCLFETQRILRVGGRVLLTTPNPNGWKKRLLQSTIYTTSHLSQHFPEILKLRLRMSGFSRVTLCGSGKSTRFIGSKIPLLNLYGSFLIHGDKI